MTRNSRALRPLSWTLFAVVLLGLVSCDTQSSPSASLIKPSRESRKYLELEDLNGEEGPSSSGDNTGEELSDDRRAEFPAKKNARPKKFVKRSARSEEARQQQQQRAVRQTAKKQQKPRPGFFWTIARVTFETFNETRSAIQQIGQIIGDSIPAEPKKPKNSANLKKKPLAPKQRPVSVNGTTTTEAPTTTAEPEFMLTRPLLQSLIRRNVKGLVRLFNIEWRDALNQSEKNVQEFQRDLKKQVGIYLADNPNAY